MTDRAMRHLTNPEAMDVIARYQRALQIIANGNYGNIANGNYGKWSDSHPAAEIDNGAFTNPTRTRPALARSPGTVPPMRGRRVLDRPPHLQQRRPEMIDPDRWIPWPGGECPVAPETEVEIKFSDGVVIRPRASSVRWNHINTLGDIVAYRVVHPDTKGHVAPAAISPDDPRVAVVVDAGWPESDLMRRPELDGVIHRAQRIVEALFGEPG